VSPPCDLAFEEVSSAVLQCNTLSAVMESALIFFPIRHFDSTMRSLPHCSLLGNNAWVLRIVQWYWHQPGDVVSLQKRWTNCSVLREKRTSCREEDALLQTRGVPPCVSCPLHLAIYLLFWRVRIRYRSAT
jgi:hypothetical protein